MTKVADDAERAGLVKIVAVLRVKDGITTEQFVEHWRVQHPAYVCRLPGLRAYRQNMPVPHRRESPFDGVAELWFDSVRDVAVAFESPAADDMRADERRFVGSIEWILADEVEIDVTRLAREGLASGDGPTD
jgi:uncharacterized protein (TIGR02118 family)